MFRFTHKPSRMQGPLRHISLATGIAALSVGAGLAQSGGGNSSSNGNTGDADSPYKVTSSVEFGVRSGSVVGNLNKFKSDLNYKRGFRLFDSSVMIESRNPDKEKMDSLLIMTSGWGGDPSGYTRISGERTGWYRVDSNFRRVKYFNNLNNHAANEHNMDTAHTFGDFDVVLRPQSEKLRILFGSSFNRTKGPGTTTGRGYRDDFMGDVAYDYRSVDFRGGIEGRLLGFNIGITQGHRRYTDRTRFSLLAPTVGNNTTDTTVFNTWLRTFPIKGSTNFSMFNIHRTFAKKVDFTGKYVYSTSSADTPMLEQISGRDNSNNYIDLDEFTILGDAKRIQQKANLGWTFMPTDNFRISETFGLDTFGIDGGEYLREFVISRTSAGVPRVINPNPVLSTAFRVTDYKRYMNTVEGDYQFNKRVSAHIGYRYTKRRVDLWGFDRTITSATSSTNPLLISEEEENSTNTLIAGMKIKPIDHWVLFWDIERGDADNIFTRVENYKYTNFRVRSRVTLKNFGLSLSAISRDNNNPTVSNDAPPVNFGVDSNTRIYSSALDFTPVAQLAVSSGYTYTHVTAATAIRINTGTYLYGSSRYYIRDHNAYLDVTFKPSKMVSFYAAYRISKDMGQGDRVAANAVSITSSYPLQFQSPEARMALSISKNADLNLGYQYFAYRERFQRLQDYRAHLPFVSLRVFFGNPDR